MWFPGGWVPVALGVLALVGCLTAAATARREVDRTGRHVLAALTAVAGVALCVYSFLFPIMLVSLLFEGAGAGIGASLLATGGGAVAGVLCLRVAVDQRRLAVRSCESCGECMAGRRRAGRSGRPAGLFAGQRQTAVRPLPPPAPCRTGTPRPSRTRSQLRPGTSAPPHRRLPAIRSPLIPSHKACRRRQRWCFDRGRHGGNATQCACPWGVVTDQSRAVCTPIRRQRRARCARHAAGKAARSHQPAQHRSSMRGPFPGRPGQPGGRSRRVSRSQPARCSRDSAHAYEIMN
jgi:hypothetical protein